MTRRGRCISGSGDPPPAGRAGSGHVSLYDLRARRVIQRLDYHKESIDLREIAFSPGGRLLAVAGSDGTARIWRLDGIGDRPPLAPAAEWAAHEVGLMTARFSPDGRRLATGGMDNMVRIWDVSGLLDPGATEEERKPLECARLPGHRTPVRVLQFSPRGHCLVGAGGMSKRVGEVYLRRAPQR